MAEFPDDPAKERRQLLENYSMRLELRGLRLLFVGCLALGANISQQAIADSWQKPLRDPMNNIINTSIGKPAKDVFLRLSYPDDQKIIDDRKIYIWKNGDVCTIRLFVDTSDIVRSGDWVGSFDGCGLFMQRWRMTQ